MRTTKIALSAKLPASGIIPKPKCLKATYANEVTVHKNMVARIIINQRGINLTIIATTRAEFINYAKKPHLRCWQVYYTSAYQESPTYELSNFGT